MRTGLFLDTSDLYHRIKRRYGKKLDYGKVFSFFENESDIISARTYGIQSKTEAKGFISCLQRSGYETTFMRPEEYECNGKKIRKSTTNVCLALDVVDMLGIECVVLGTGNRELAPLINYIKQRQTTTKIVLFTCNPDSELKADEILEVPECVLEG